MEPITRRGRISSELASRSILLLGLTILAATAPAGHAGNGREYAASLAYSSCMRAHGVPQPNPDRNGDIHLTRTQEERIRAVGRAKVQSADRICFAEHLRGVVSTKPLSAYAIRRAIGVLKELGACMKSFGYVEGRPVVRNLSEGRAFFGFDALPRGGPAGKPRVRAQHTCEQRVQLARRIDAIVKADRGPY
jgi:hypothetical protein